MSTFGGRDRQSLRRETKQRKLTEFVREAMGLLKNCTALMLPVFILTSALPAGAVEPDAPDELLSKDAALTGLLREELSETRKIRSQNIRDQYLDYYTNREFRPLWIEKNALVKKAKQLASEVKKANDYGLLATDYALPDLSIFDDPKEVSLKQMAETEVALSVIAVNYSRHAKGGRISPRSVSSNLDFKLNLPSPEKVLSGIEESSDAAAYLRKQHPQRREFEALRKRYVALIGGKTKTESGPQIPPGPTLRVGDKHQHVVLLRKRLKVKGSSDDPELFDDAVLDAVRDYQEKKGLTPDGIVGRGTKAAMNGVKQSGGAEASRLLVNMERWRWYPDDFGDFYIYMNIPEQQVRVFKDGEQIHQARTIIGKLTNQTVVFSDEMEHIVFHPTWNVPNSIKVHEILPYLQSNTGWFFSSDPQILKVHNLFVKQNGVDIDPSKVDWKKADIRQFHVYQPPGPKNVLGIAKFMFPNRHAIYMHDTLEKQYFNQPTRIYSHGCVRIQNAEKFATVILNADQGWSSPRTHRIIANNSTRTVKLTRKIPVHLTYFTAWVDKSGKLRTKPDVYGHDRRMARALKTGASPANAPEPQESVAQFAPKPKKKKKQQEQDPVTLMSILNAF